MYIATEMHRWSSFYRKRNGALYKNQMYVCTCM